MSARAAARSESRAPAAAAALVLHLAVFAALVWLARAPPLLPAGGATPVTIVASAPGPAAPPAPVSEPAPAAATPEPPAPPPSPPPPPRPPQAVPHETPAPPIQAAPRPAAPSHAPLDLEALAARIGGPSSSAPVRRAPARASAAASGGSRAGPSAADVLGLQQLLNRLWNPNCAAAGGSAVVVPVRFSVDRDGRLSGRISAGGEETNSDPVVFAAARRAIDAVHQAEPFAAPYRGQSIQVIFDARKACQEG